MRGVVGVFGIVPGLPKVKVFEYPLEKWKRLRLGPSKSSSSSCSPSLDAESANESCLKDERLRGGGGGGALLGSKWRLNLAGTGEDWNGALEVEATADCDEEGRVEEDLDSAASCCCGSSRLLASCPSLSIAEFQS